MKLKRAKEAEENTVPLSVPFDFKIDLSKDGVLSVYCGVAFDSHWPTIFSQSIQPLPGLDGLQPEEILQVFERAGQALVGMMDEERRQRNTSDSPRAAAGGTDLQRYVAHKILNEVKEPQ